MIGIVWPCAVRARRLCARLCGVVRIGAERPHSRQADSRDPRSADHGARMPAPDKQLSEAQSQEIAALIREEIARRRISRQQLADQAKLSISTLEKALGGRRPFTLATT